MPLKILLLDPPHKIFGALRMWMPSPGLMALAAYLEANGRAVDVIDATTFDLPWTWLKNRLKEGRYDIVGITCSAATFHLDAISAVRLTRSVLPNAIIAAGGGHFSLNAEKMMTDVPELDYIVIGEGEEAFLDLIQWLESGDRANPCNASGLIRRKGDQTEKTALRPLIADLDVLPMPAYHKMDLENPTYYLHGMGRRAIGVSTSRGCGDRCSYCSEAVLWNSNWRGRSAGLVVEEMRMLKSRYNKTLFVFNENSFNQSRERNQSFLEHLGHSGLRCDFWFQSRVKDILRDQDLLDDFKRLGCYEVMLGVESIRPETLKNYAKKQTFEDIREAAMLLRSKGIMVMTNVMFGDTDDTEETLRQICDFVTDIGDFLVLTITTPLPGTRYHQQAIDAGRIKDHDFYHYDFMHPVMRNRACTRDEILALQKKYLRRYYTRPAIFINMLFSRNRFKRMAYRLIMRYAWYEARNREWIQGNYEEIPEGLRSLK
jgi:anaerobic magnesium-protoporphyrin IX monomethyl ester cyclase